jgi:hypothetical protein
LTDSLTLHTLIIDQKYQLMIMILPTPLACGALLPEVLHMDPLIYQGLLALLLLRVEALLSNS